MFRVLHGLAESIGNYICPVVAARGIIMDEDAADYTKMAKATGEYKGILTQDVTSDGLSYLEQDMKIPSTEAKVDDRATLRAGHGEIVTDVVAGYGETGEINDSTAHDTELSVYAGKWRVAQGGDLTKGRFIGLYEGTSSEYHIEVF